MTALGTHVLFADVTKNSLCNVGFRGPQVRKHFYSFDAVHKDAT
jgi:hypothetical protein